MSVWCQICNEMKPCDEAIQLIPCLHTFCRACIKELGRNQKSCPSMHCYSNITPPDLVISTCEGEKCQKKVTTAPEMLRTACNHDICQHCFDMACRKEKLACPAPNCGEPMIDDEDLICDGPCKQILVHDKSVTIPCCGAKMCEDCAANNTKTSDFCPPGKCIIKETGKKKKSDMQTRHTCLCTLNCEGEVLRNFPSEFECEHDVCIGCITAMLSECEKNGKSPCCPNKTCGIPYRCESVLALRAQFPDKKDYFAKFSLSVQFSMQTLKDETVTEIVISENFEKELAEQTFTIKVGACDDDENAQRLDYVKNGTLGDLIREVRRVLKILATEKIYGYYRSEDGKQVPLEVSQKTIRKTCDELGITEKTTILVDTSGIVGGKK
ncbi:unnamed protein product [Caenorhabditis angaria]|uniref:RING-type domain-containing protein n=1 Tax=Caenorhabditis angaria TaxID=860376 RepID=A0A9P1MVP6_9PELO|nr:unnamed protein product [Caenorhabditis angaria]